MTIPNRVVIVEDNDDVAFFLLTALRQVLPETEFCTIEDDFGRCFEMDTWDDVDVAVVDLMLPGFDGGEIILWLEKNCPWIRRIVLSAIAHTRPKLEEHADAFLLKPVPIDMLVTALEGVGG